MRRGEVRWYKFSPPDKRRPVLLLTRDAILEYLGDVTVAPITGTIRNIPSEVRLSKEDGMPQDCAINCDQSRRCQGPAGPIGDNGVRCQDARGVDRGCFRLESRKMRAPPPFTGGKKGFRYATTCSRTAWISWSALAKSSDDWQGPNDPIGPVVEGHCEVVILVFVRAA